MRSTLRIHLNRLAGFWIATKSTATLASRKNAEAAQLDPATLCQVSDYCFEKGIDDIFSLDAG